VRQPGTEITIQNWVNSKDVVPRRIIEMPLVCYIVKIREILTQATFVLALLQDVLSFVPVPCLINLAKIFDDQVINLDSFLAITENTETF
jgi:hypothetical protein